MFFYLVILENQYFHDFSVAFAINQCSKKLSLDVSVTKIDFLKNFECFSSFSNLKQKVQMFLQGFLRPKNRENFYSTTPPTYQMILLPSRALGRKGKSLYVYISVQGKRTEKFEEKLKEQQIYSRSFFNYKDS